MGICMWNMGNAENTDYGQMEITEDYLMWFAFMYGLQSDYYIFYLFLPLTTCTLSSLDIYLYLVFPSNCSCATSDIFPTSLPVALLVHTPTFIGIQHRLDMHTVTSDWAPISDLSDH